MKNPPDILQKIIAYKKQFVNFRKQELPLAILEKEINVATALRGFAKNLEKKVRAGHIAVIAEIKKASPSRGVLRENFNPVEIAKSYEKHGATCLSVLTDEKFFQGSDEHLQLAKAATTLPILRKDFVIDPYQIYEARALGADSILLIVAALDDKQLQNFTQLANELGIDVLVEVHDAEELQRALALDATLIGINNRDLRTFTTRLDTTLELIEKIPSDKMVVTESGIHTCDDILLMRKNGVHVFLIGEAFMKEMDPGIKLAELMNC